ncbi:transforming acidic coiled-coil-containing protein 3 isoform X2 [Hypomesus transpacificus]|uniref:transforming acidic coiled-coil-containing protein 3 isoform X2 n=1 Tax=Hypomesus transpacificus TaxID=137520 RepID=UPI001F082C69|nr:transforming acidic coiled-coil-containing protein 3 isoform X2 [Hypomesus transpacificus]
MSSVPVNDENRGVCPERKHSESDSSFDIFSLDQPTGRPSILRQSQAENLPNKSVAKGIKVCFQTPRRDPVTKRIVSPTKSLKMASLDECTKALEALQLSTTLQTQESTGTLDGPQSDFTDSLPFPNEDMPIQSKGGYQLDFDNLDAMNPFQGAAQMIPSPPRPWESVEEPMLEVQNELASGDSFTPEERSEEFVTALDETLPFLPSVENSIADMSGDVNSTDSSVIVMAKSSAFEFQDVSNSEEEPPAVSFDCLDQDEALSRSSAFEDAPLPTKGSYNFNFDDLDSVNPFQMGGAKIQNSPELGRKLTCEDPPAAVERQELEVGGGMEAEVLTVSQPIVETPVLPEKQEMEDEVLTVSQPIVETPVLPEKQEMEAEVLTVSQPIVETPVLPEMKPIAAMSPTSSEPPAESMLPPKEGAVKLEFNFDDGAVKHKPPPKKFGKRPAGMKATAKKPVSEKKDSVPSQSPPVKQADDAEVAVPKGSYAFDFDKLDDPNYNPFGSNARMTDSPKCGVVSSPLGVMSSPQGKPPSLVEEVASDESVKQNTSSLPIGVSCGGDDSPATVIHLETNPKKEREFGIPVTDVSTLAIGHIHQDPDHMTQTHERSDDATGFLGANDIAQSQQPLAGPLNDQESTEEPAQPVLSTPECALSEQPPQNGMEPMEDFVPGAMFMSNDFDGQMDYLEQFGSTTFKESALRKQSLYLKFDPLLRESPKKAGGVPGLDNLPRPAAFASRMEANRSGAKESMSGQKMDDFTLGIPAQTAPLLEGLAPAFSQPTSEGAIIEVLKYSQKDMDDAIARVEAREQEKEKQWTAKYDELSLDNQELRNILSGYESTIVQMMAEHQKEKDMAQSALCKVLQEKEQIAADLNAMERSLSDLCKRLDKHKDAIGGYKKNEEVLKKCAQDYLAEIKKGEQRYQALKAHAEEKISLANGEIAEVRSKLKSESSALKAQLRREQLKVQSLDKNLDQKVKEVEELTNLCDELIAKVQKG